MTAFYFRSMKGQRALARAKDIVCDIIEELANLQKLPQPPVDDDDPFPLPRMVSVGNGQVLYVSREFDVLISRLSSVFYDGADTLKSRFARDEHRNLVREAAGRALMKVDLSLSPCVSAGRALADIESECERVIQHNFTRAPKEYAFGCTLFASRVVEAFDIGPVRFEPREVWLQRKASDGKSARIVDGGQIERFDHNIADGPVSLTTQRRILRRWGGKALQKRKSSYDSINEEDIVRAIGESSYVCSVKAAGLGSKLGHDRALQSARLALATVALIWEVPSKALDGMNLLYDRTLRQHHSLSFTSDGLMLGGSSTSGMQRDAWASSTELQSYFSGYSKIFEASGNAIGWFLGPFYEYDNPEVLNVLAQALLWFHDGCRDLTDLKAIVCFASCMDILASGAGRKGIRELIESRLATGADKKIRDGLTISDAIDLIYDTGRNRFLHGPRQKGQHVWSDQLGHDWSDTRELAERIARLCLITCLEWAADNPACNDPEQLRK